MAIKRRPPLIWVISDHLSIHEKAAHLAQQVFPNHHRLVAIEAHATSSMFCTLPAPDCLILEINDSARSKEALTALLVNLGTFKAQNTVFVFVTEKRGFKGHIDCVGCHSSIIARYSNLEARITLALNRVTRHLNLHPAVLSEKPQPQPLPHPAAVSERSHTRLPSNRYNETQERADA